MFQKALIAPVALQDSMSGVERLCVLLIHPLLLLGPHVE